MVFKKKNSTAERPSSSELYCTGYNAGANLIKEIPVAQQELTTKILHDKILEQPQDVFYQAVLAGFCYEIERIKIKERNQERLKELENINKKTRNKDLERGR